MGEMPIEKLKSVQGSKQNESQEKFNPEKFWDEAEKTLQPKSSITKFIPDIFGDSQRKATDQKSAIEGLMQKIDKYLSPNKPIGELAENEDERLMFKCKYLYLNAKTDEQIKETTELIRKIIDYRREGIRIEKNPENMLGFKDGGANPEKKFTGKIEIKDFAAFWQDARNALRTKGGEFEVNQTFSSVVKKIEQYLSFNKPISDLTPDEQLMFLCRYFSDGVPKEDYDLARKVTADMITKRLEDLEDFDTQKQKERRGIITASREDRGDLEKKLSA